MKIKALWGFKGDPAAVGNEDGRVLSGTVLTVADAYGHYLVGAKLAKPHGDEAEAAYQSRSPLSNADQEALAQAHTDIREREDKLAASITDFEARRGDLDSVADALAAREGEIKAREEVLADREAEIERREAELAKLTGESEGGSAGGDETDGSTNGKPGKVPKSTKPAAPEENK